MTTPISPPLQMVMLAYPGMTQLDLTGPFEVFARARGIKTHLAWKAAVAVSDANGLRILPSTTFADCPKADILFVPGGPGQLELMDDAGCLAFLRTQAAGASYITSVCTGSLILAACGLLTGYQATCHWMSLPQLRHFGAQPVAERVVVDRNRITGAGVTSGIDFALSLVSLIFGDEEAKAIQLSMEYDPKPPFRCGSPGQADPALVAKVENFSAEFQARRDIASIRAAARLISRTIPPDPE